MHSTVLRYPYRWRPEHETTWKCFQTPGTLQQTCIEPGQIIPCAICGELNWSRFWYLSSNTRLWFLLLPPQHKTQGGCDPHIEIDWRVVGEVISVNLSLLTYLIHMSSDTVIISGRYVLQNTRLRFARLSKLHHSLRNCSLNITFDSIGS